jgi:hypothetical protein
MLHGLALRHIESYTGVPQRSDHNRLWHGSSIMGSLSHAVSGSDAGSSTTQTMTLPFPGQLRQVSPEAAIPKPLHAVMSMGGAAPEAISPLPFHQPAMFNPFPHTCHGRLEKHESYPEGALVGTRCCTSPREIRKTCSCSSLLSTYATAPSSGSSRSPASLSSRAPFSCPFGSNPTSTDNLRLPLDAALLNSDGAAAAVGTCKVPVMRTSLLTLAKADIHPTGDERVQGPLDTLLRGAAAQGASLHTTIGTKGAALVHAPATCTEMKRLSARRKPDKLFSKLPGLPPTLHDEALQSGFHRPVRVGAMSSDKASSRIMDTGDQKLPGSQVQQPGRLEQMTGKADLHRY